MQGFLARIADSDVGEPKHFYLVDESSLASTNQIREFFSRVGPNDHVLLIGDIRQHQGVEAGRPFEQLQEAGMRTAKLDQIVRQQDPALKSAVELLATGQVSAALDALQQQGRLKEISNPEERVRTIANCYVESADKTLIVSPDNVSRRELNVAVRQELKTCSTRALPTSPSPVPATRLRWKARPPARSRCLEDLRAGNQAAFIRGAGNRARCDGYNTTIMPL